MIVRFRRLISWWPVERAIYVACVIGLCALGLMAAGIVTSSPLMLVASMSLSQALGVLAGAVFAISIAAEAVRRR
jgi:hypothetical protein